MIRVQPLLAAGVLGAAAQVVAGQPDARRARALATGSVGAAVVLLVGIASVLGACWDRSEIGVLGLRLELVGRGWYRTAPFVDLLVALLAVSLAPAATHGARTLAVILRLIAIALAFLGFTDPIGLAVLWLLQFVVAARELYRIDETCGRVVARLFTRYQSMAVASVMIGTVALSMGWHTLGIAAWLLAMAMREAVVPFHGWLPGVMARAPLGLVVAFVAPQPGVCAHLNAFSDLTGGALAHGFAAAGAITGVCGAALGVVQTSARRAAAWLVVSQTGLIAFGLANESPVGRIGAVLSWQVMALAMSGYVMTLAALESRRGSLTLQVAAGSFARTPRMAVSFLFLGFASVALPLTLGFVAEDLLVQGSIEEFPQVGFAVIGATALNGINVLRCFFVLFSGTDRHYGESDLTRRERWALTLVMGSLLLGGLVPRLFLDGAAPPGGSTQGSHR